MDYDNMKITTPEDIKLAEIQLVNDREKRKQEKWRLRYDTINGIFHPDSQDKGFIYALLFLAVFGTICGMTCSLLT